MATLEEARVCSRCEKPGDLGGVSPMKDRPGYKIITATCRNQLCVWFETGWPIMINPDGTVPDPPAPGQARGDKQWGNPLTGAAKLQSKEEANDFINRANRHAGSLQNPGNREV